MAEIDRGKRQIATFKNRVESLVPKFRQITPDRKSITVTRKSVELGTYAPYSDVISKEGMFIQKHSINDGHCNTGNWKEYLDKQLVAQVDLNYRFLSPINPNTPDKPGTTSPKNIISNDGCVEIDNLSQTILSGTSYVAHLTVKEGFSKIPDGYVEMQDTDGNWNIVVVDGEELSWTNVQDKDIIIPEVTGNLRFIFDEGCVEATHNVTLRWIADGVEIAQSKVEAVTHGSTFSPASHKNDRDITGYHITSMTPENDFIVNSDSGVTYYCEKNEYTVTYIGNNVTLTDSTQTIKHGESTTNTYTLDAGYSGVSVSSVNPSGNVESVTAENGTINVNTVTGNVTITITGSLSSYTVTFEGDANLTITDSTKTVQHGGGTTTTFNLTSGYEVESITVCEGSAEVTTSGNTIMVSNVTSNAKICGRSRQSVTVTNIYASDMDAMGGIKLYAKSSDNTFITDPNLFTVKSYKIGTGSEVNVSNNDQENVTQVFDYNFKDNSSYPGGITTAQAAKVDKKRIKALENAKTSSRTVTLTVECGGLTKTITGISQRGESYGYPKAISSNSTTDDIWNNKSSYWVSGSSYLPDYGGSCEMYGAPTETQGLDIYNKDITPYYIAGTDVGDNPLTKLSSGVTFVNSSGSSATPTNFNKPNDNSHTTNKHHGDHYHTRWESGGEIGELFDYDTLTANIKFCGNKIGSCTCSSHEESSGQIDKTVEALSKNGNITKSPDVVYKIYYVKPVHRYGRDSVSYYHNNNVYKIQLSNEASFKNKLLQPITFSYPKHIQLNSASKSKTVSYSDNASSLESVRWESSSNSSNIKPEDYSTNYYDYSNIIDATSSNVTFNPYNNTCYDNNTIGYNVTLSDDTSSKGRVVTTYYTRMSNENMVRPRPAEGVNGGYKFAKLNGNYSNINYNNRSDNFNTNYFEYCDIDTYCNTIQNIQGQKYIRKDANHIEPLEGVTYPYDYNHVNTDFRSLITSTGYEAAQAMGTESDYKHNYHNLCGYIRFEQYYNNPSVFTTDKTHYLHNKHYDKFVGCVAGFIHDGNRIEYYEDVNNNNLSYWTDEFVSSITEITRVPNSSTQYKLKINGVEDPRTFKKGSSYEYDGMLYYPEQEYTFEDIISTNANSRVQVSFVPSEGQTIGAFEVYVNGNLYATRMDVSQTNRTSIEIEGSAGGDGNRDITIKAYTNSSTAIPFINKGIYNPGYENHVHTGGGLFEITAAWSDGDVRTIQIPMDGSCSCNYAGDKNQYPNASGARLSWKTLAECYVKSDESDNDNRGGELKLKIQPQ